MNFLSVENIYKKEKNFELNNISFTQKSGQKIGIAGETGSGKSTLLKIIAGLVQLDAGRVFFEQERVLGPEEKLIPGHSSIAYLSQHFELRNNYRVEEVLQMSNKLRDEESQSIFEVCRISHLLQRKTDQLSGGEKQRIATARLLISSPRLLLLDEPYSNLDIIHKNILKAVITDISEKLGISLIMVSHDPIDILSWADKIIIMKDGRILQQGTAVAVYKQPFNEYVASLFGGYSILPPSLAVAFGIIDNSLNKKKLLVRPEQFVMSKDKGTRCLIEKVTFFGSYYEIQTMVNDTFISIKTNDSTLASGDTIYISIPPGAGWYL